MDDRTTNPLLRYLHKMAAPAEVGRLTDRQLLERFVQRRDEAAFEVLVHRHGPMVWRVCRLLLHNAQDCEDACQATFLVLVRKAGSVARPELLGNWLYGVAWRVAGRIRKTVGRRQAHERPGAEALARQAEGATGGTDWMADLHEELHRLPASYRRPLVLCYLEGRTNEEVARQLGCPLGTLKVRLMRGRDMLRARLARRGLALSPGVLASALSSGANEALPASMVETTVKAGLLFAAGRAVAAGAPGPRAVALTNGVLQAMWWAKVKALAAVLFTVGLCATSGGWLVFGPTAAPAAPNRELPGDHATASRPEPEVPKPAQAPERPAGGRRLPPGGDAPVTQARLSRACLHADQHAWYFRGKQFILAADKGELPTGLAQALLGPEGKAARIVGAWDLDAVKGQLVLTALVADGKPGPKEVRLGIGPAGLIRVNVEKAGQYDLMSFEDKLHVPGPGEIFPIYDFANRIDLEFLQGAWDLRSSEADGKALEASALKGSQILVKGNAITLVFQGATSRGTFQLDSVPTPRTLDVTFTEGPEKGNKYLGIYELQEDTWRFCRAPSGKGRPAAFAGKAGSGHVLETRGRVTESAAGPPSPSGERGGKPPEGRVAALIKQLGDDDFERREAASKALDQIGEDALPELRRAERSSDAEVGRRAAAVIQAIGGRVFVEVRRFTGHTDGVITVAVSPDGRRALSGAWGGQADHTVRLWDLATAKEIHQLEGHTHGITGVAFSPDGKRALSAGLDTTVRLWDLECGKELKCLKGHKAEAFAVAFTPDGKSAVSGAHEEPIHVWDLEKGEIRRTLRGHTGAARSLAFSPDGRLLASSGFDGAVCVWEFESGKLVHRLAVTDSAVAVFVAFSPDGGRLVTGSYDHSVKLWDVKTGKVLHRLEGHTQPIHAVAFTTDGRKVLSASLDKTVRLWDAASGTELHCYSGHSGEALGLSCTPDGRYVLSASYDKSVRIWRLPK